MNTKIRWKVAVCLTVLLAPMLGALDRAEATPSGFNGHIAFHKREQGLGYSIQAVAPDGSSHRYITTGVVDARDAAWSPDGTKIAYASGNEIQVMNADGSGSTKFSKAGSYTRDPSWSPDGKKIAFDVSDGPTMRLGLVDVATGWKSQQVVQPAAPNCPWKSKTDPYGSFEVLSCEAKHFAGPSYSPGGSMIALVVTYVGEAKTCEYVSEALGPETQCTVGPFKRGSLSVMNENLTGLTHVAEVHDNSAPSWSPDNKMIVFNCDLGLVCLTDTNGKSDIIAVGASNATFSPDGNEIAFERDDRIVVADAGTFTDADGGTVIADGTNPDWQPTFSVVGCAIKKIALSGSLLAAPVVVDQGPAGAGGAAAAPKLKLPVPIGGTVYQHGAPVMGVAAPATHQAAC